MTAGSSETVESTDSLSAWRLTSVGFGALGVGEAFGAGAGACADAQTNAAAIKKQRDRQRLISKMLLFIGYDADERKYNRFIRRRKLTVQSAAQ